jgi:aromatic ring hydroxylase
MEEDIFYPDLIRIEDEYQLMEFIEEKFTSKNSKNTEANLKHFKNLLSKHLNKNKENVLINLNETTDKIIKMYQDINITKDDLIKSKRNIDSLSNQILM